MRWSFWRREKRSAKSFCIGSQQGPLSSAWKSRLRGIKTLARRRSLPSRRGECDMIPSGATKPNQQIVRRTLVLNKGLLTLPAIVLVLSLSSGGYSVRGQGKANHATEIVALLEKSG